MRDVLRGLWLTNAYLNCKRFVPFCFIYPPFSPQDDMAPEELLFEFSPARLPLKPRETSFAFVELIQSLSWQFETCSPLEKGWDNTIPAIHSGPASPDSWQSVA